MLDAAHADGLYFSFVAQFGDTSPLLSQGAAGVAVDPANYVYTVGTFLGNVDVDPGPGVVTLTGSGSSDVYVAKLDASGNFIWAKSFGGGGGDSGRDIAVDADGNVYIVGSFWGTSDFDPGPGTFELTSQGQQLILNDEDVFVSKLDTNGDFVWARAFSGESTNDGRSIAVDISGNVVTTGYYRGTVDFDPGPGTLDRTSRGKHDVFVSKLDSNGDLVWVKTMGGAEFDLGQAVAVDAAGNVYAAGIFQETVDFDPGFAVANRTSVGGNDVYVCKFGAGGAFLWARSMGGSDQEGPNGIAVDNAGNVLTAGFFQGAADFDPGGGVFNLPAPEHTDAFISKLDSSGSFVWAKAFAGSFTVTAKGVAVDGAGNVYTAGGFVETVDFDPGPGVFHLTPVDQPGVAISRDIYVSKLDAGGNFVLAASMGGQNVASANDIALDFTGGILTTGYFTKTNDFDPSYTQRFLTSAGDVDAFVSRLVPTNPLPAGRPKSHAMLIVLFIAATGFALYRAARTNPVSGSL